MLPKFGIRFPSTCSRFSTNANGSSTFLFPFLPSRFVHFSKFKVLFLVALTKFCFSLSSSKIEPQRVSSFPCKYIQNRLKTSGKNSLIISRKK